MGTNGGSGMGGGVGHEAGGIMGNSTNQPPTTEYTLQGRCSHGWIQGISC
jgi:striatin 1/3/4